MLVEGSATRSSDTSNHLRTRQVYNISEFPQEQPIQTLQPDQLRGFQDLRPAAQPQRTTQSQVSNHYGSVSSVLSYPGQVGGLSGHRLNINHFTNPITSEVGVKEICGPFPYPIGPSLLSIFRSRGQHSFAMAGAAEGP